jgi:hypothetical protein
MKSSFSFSTSAASDTFVRLTSFVGVASALRAGVEGAVLMLLAAACSLALGRGTYEAVTTLQLAAAAPRSALSPVTAAKLLLERALQQSNDPPLPNSATAPRQFRVDVLRNNDIKLVCRAETAVVVEDLCNAAANDVLPSGLRVVRRAQAGSIVFTSVFAAVWPALLVGLGWFLIRRS